MISSLSGTRRSASTPMPRISLLRAIATPQYPSVCVTLPTTPGGQVGKRSSSMSTDQRAIPNWDSAARAQCHPAIDSSRRFGTMFLVHRSSSGYRGSRRAGLYSSRVTISAGKSFRIGNPWASLLIRCSPLCLLARRLLDLFFTRPRSTALIILHPFGAGQARGATPYMRSTGLFPKRVGCVAEPPGTGRPALDGFF